MPGVEEDPPVGPRRREEQRRVDERAGLAERLVHDPHARRRRVEAVAALAGHELGEPAALVPAAVPVSLRDALLPYAAQENRDRLLAYVPAGLAGRER